MIATIFVLHLSVNAYGVPGSGTIAIDETTGSFVRRFAAGPASEQEGYDGRNAWRADATGMARIEGNSGERSEILQWSQALRSSIGPNVPTGGTLRARISGATDHVTVTFDRYRRFGGVEAPTRIVSQSEQNGTWIATVRTISDPQRVSAQTFAPPAGIPHDFRLSAITRVPVSMSGGSPVVDATIGGKTMHFLLDTGGQNVLTDRSAKALGLNVVGKGVVGGGGGGTVAIRYATVPSLKIGEAELFNQPFIVLPEHALPPVDGIVGYELLARMAARLDMAHETLELAPSAAAFGAAVTPAPFVYFDRQPQVNGALDAAIGAFSIDTGSSLNAQIQTPVVRKYDLVNRLHATVAAYANDVGGRYPIYLVRAKEMRLGNAVFPSPIVDLLTRVSTSNNASIVGNVGDGILKRWVLVFDYPHQTIDFRPGGDETGNVIHDHSGMVLGTESDSLVIEQVLGGTPADEAGLKEGAKIVSVDGSAVSGSDLTRVRTLLRGDPGTKVAVTLNDGTTHELLLRQYL